MLLLHDLNYIICATCCSASASCDQSTPPPVDMPPFSRGGIFGGPRFVRALHHHRLPDKPTMVFTIGLPGSGKTYALKQRYGLAAS